MNINCLLLITDFNNNSKLRKLNINEVVDKMNQFEDMFKLNYTMRTNKNKVFTIDEGIYKFNCCLFLYIDHYKHLTDDKKELSKIKAIGIKKSMKFSNYLYNYNCKNGYNIDNYEDAEDDE